MQYHQVVTSFLTNAQQILILRRSGKVGSYRGKWSAVSGYLEGTEQPLTRAVTEIHEEIGLTDEQINLIRFGEPLRAYDQENEIVWIIHPFLFQASSKAIKLDWENVEYRWVAPEELPSYEIVPKLRETLDRVRYDLESVPESLTAVAHKVKQLGEDRVHGATFIGREAVGLLSEAAQASEAKDTGTLFSHLLLVGLRLRHVQPAMANVWNLIGMLLQTADQHQGGGRTHQELRSLIGKRAAEILEDGTQASEEVARNCANRLPEKGVLLTHSYSSTVLRSLELAFKGGRRFTVYATESYPGMEGKEMAKELIKLGIPTALIADSAVNSILHEVNLILVGADGVLKDGTLIHKVGTREIGTAAHELGIPLYSLTEITKFSTQHFLGERPEIPKVFDLTPPELVSGYLTEEGELPPAAVEQRIRIMQKSIYP